MNNRNANYNSIIITLIIVVAILQLRVFMLETTIKEQLTLNTEIVNRINNDYNTTLTFGEMMVKLSKSVLENRKAIIKDKK